MTSLTSYLRLYRAHGFKRVWMHVKEVVWFDWRHGVDTATWLPLSDYAMDTTGMKHYQASLTSEILRVFSGLRERIDPSGYHFFDMGAGKGKVLILASLHLKPASLTGVELHPGLARAGRQNLERLGIAATMVQAPVQDFTGYAERSILYLCDPFGEDILKRMIENLQAQSKHALLIYNNPVYDVTPYGWKKLFQTDGWHANHRTAVYQWDAPS